MLSWERPQYLWFMLSLLPITLFYFLRMRFRRLPTSSTYIWARLGRIAGGGSRLRRWSIWLLLLQLLAAAAAAFFLAGPYWIDLRPTGPGRIFLLDVSASMTADEGGLSRLEMAKSLLAGEIEHTPGNTVLAAFCCSETARLLTGPTTDGGKLLSLVKAVEGGEGGFDEAGVVEDLRVWMAAQDRPWSAFLISDGGLDLGGRRLAEAFDGNLDLTYVGKSGENLGLAGLRLLPDMARFYVYNGWPSRREAKLRLTMNGNLLAETELEIPPGLSPQMLPLEDFTEEAGAYELRLEQPPDALPADDAVYLAVNPSQEIQVLFVGPPDPFIQASLRRPGIVLTEAADFSPDLLRRNFDLIVANQVPVPAGIDGNLLTFGELPPDAPLRAGGPIDGQLAILDSAHPLTRYMDLGKVTVGNGKALALSGNAQVLAAVAGEPVLAAWDSGGRHCATWGFSLPSSDLGLSSAFPVFMQNFLEWCIPQFDNPLAYTLTVGETSLLAEPDSWRIDSRGTIRVDRYGPLAAVNASQAGVYTWRRETQAGFLAVNLPAPESRISPQILTLDAKPLSTPAQLASPRRSMSRWALILLLVFLCAEWVMWRSGRPLRGGERECGGRTRSG